MSKTLKDFRDFLKPSAKKSNFYIQDAFKEVLNIVERQLKYSYLDFSITYSKNDLVVYGYKNEFMQVLITILNNAKDAILKVKEDNRNYDGVITVTVSSKQDVVKILIVDNGCGIEDKDREYLFNPYYSTKEKGNGLGLYMSRTLIKDKMKNIIVNSSRYSAAKIAIKKKFNVLILDDGLQDSSIYKHLNIACFNNNQLIGNGMTIPS